MSDTASLTIESPENSQNDEEITIAVTGTSPDTRVTIEAILVDDTGTEWKSENTFRADGEGTVSLATDAPESGSYEGAQPMGWLWSMTTDAETPLPALGERATVDIELRATTREQSTERTITRHLYDDAMEIRTISDPDIAGRLYIPKSDGPNSGVMVLHGSSGENSERFLRLLATQEFTVLALQYFGDEEILPDELARIPLSYFDRAGEWFRSHTAVSGEQLGVVGVSRGAELALLLGSRFDWVGPVISYAGSGVLYDTPSGQPAWVDEDGPIPHISGKGEPERMEDGGISTRPVLERGLDAADEDSLRAATIPVEKTDGPILLLSGADDLVWPADRLADIAVQRLETKAFEYDFEHRAYDSAGHLIPVPYAPHAAIGGGTPAGAAHAGADSWPTVLAYLENRLASADER